MQKYVRIIKTATGEVVNQMGPLPDRQAWTCAAGASRNLNHNEYHIDVTDADDE